MFYLYVSKYVALSSRLQFCFCFFFQISNCQCNLFSKKNPIIRIFCISGWRAFPINRDKWSYTVLTSKQSHAQCMNAASTHQSGVRQNERNWFQNLVHYSICSFQHTLKYMYLGVIRSRSTAQSTVTIQHNHLNMKNIIQNKKYKCKNKINVFSFYTRHK